MWKSVDWNALNNDLSNRIFSRSLLGELLAGLGCEVEENFDGSRFRGPCPVHGGNNRTGFEVRADDTAVPIRWACHTEKCHLKPKLLPNLLGLVRGVLGDGPDRPARMADAVRHVEEALKGPSVARRPGHGAPPRRAPQQPRLRSRKQVREELRIPSGYYRKQGFNPTTLDLLDVGDGTQWRAFVPVYDDRGEWCVGMVSRSMLPLCRRCKRCHLAVLPCSDGVPKWKVEEGFRKGDYLYNLSQARQWKGTSVLLVEGPADVLKAHEAGIPAVSTLGADVTASQFGKLASLGRQVVVAFDNDAAGRSAAQVVNERLTRMRVPVEVRHPPAVHKDVGEMAPAEVEEWAADLVAVPRRKVPLDLLLKK